jgi:hypothetical protein
MSASGWESPPSRPAPDEFRDATGEPIGYNLGDVHYEQPPLPGVLSPTTPPPRATAAKVGVWVSGIGLVGSTFVLGAPIALVGLVISAVALSRSSRGTTERTQSVAGVVLGILGVVGACIMLWGMFIGGALTP